MDYQHVLKNTKTSTKYRLWTLSERLTWVATDAERLVEEVHRLLESSKLKNIMQLIWSTLIDIGISEHYTDLHENIIDALYLLRDETLETGQSRLLAALDARPDLLNPGQNEKSVCAYLLSLTIF